MRNVSIAVVLLALFVTQLPAADKKVAEHLQDISVTIRSESAFFASEGSGVAFSRDGQTFIWTAAHVVRNLRTTRMVIDPATGTERTIIEFDNAKIIKRFVEGGRTVGRSVMIAEIIRYSGFTYGEDLALLRVMKRDFIKSSVKFYSDGEIPELGEDLIHVGSLLGQMGSNSMTKGIMSQHGRTIGKKEYDQTTVTAFPGSSGGGVYLTNGEYIGMVVRGAGEGFNLIVPSRRMRAWAKSAKIEWAIDQNVPMPSKEEMAKMPIEDIGTSFNGNKTDNKSFPFLIRTFAIPPIIELREATQK